MQFTFCVTLVARTEPIDLIRDETNRVIIEEGPWTKWQKPYFTKLRQSNSFMKEPQRFNPPILLSVHRFVLKNHKLSDVMIWPENLHVSMAVNAI